MRFYSSLAGIQDHYSQSQDEPFCTIFRFDENGSAYCAVDASNEDDALNVTAFQVVGDKQDAEGTFLVIGNFAKSQLILKRMAAKIAGDVFDQLDALMQNPDMAAVFPK